MLVVVCACEEGAKRCCRRVLRFSVLVLSKVKTTVLCATCLFGSEGDDLFLWYATYLVARFLVRQTMRIAVIGKRKES